jgi:tetratricopeptide (TPR) repeat protein
MIVLGYGGNDESLMNYLKGIGNRKPIYWCYREEYELTDKIKELLKNTDFVIKISSFDKFMLMLSDKLNFEALVDKDDINQSIIVQNAIENAKSYEKQLEELTKEQLDSKEQEAIKKLLPNWWDYELEAMNEEDIEKKEEIYQEGIEAHPNSHELRNNYGVLLDEIKEYDKAIELYKEAIELNPKYDSSYNNMGSAYHKKKEYDKAIKSYKKAIELNPKNNLAYNNMGLAYYKKEEYDKAIKSYEKAIEINSKYNSAYTNLFELQLTQDQPFDQELEKEYIEYFQEKKDVFILYDMLKIFQAITQGKEANMDGWKQKYSGISFDDWSFNELRTWISKIKDEELRIKLEKALSFFEGW